ncbi:hypothetical protein D3C87_1850000 [compost metagenome]
MTRMRLAVEDTARIATGSQMWAIRSIILAMLHEAVSYSAENSPPTSAPNSTAATYISTSARRNDGMDRPKKEKAVKR